MLGRTSSWTIAVRLLLVGAALWTARDVSRLLFHSIVEIFTIAISGAVFMLASSSDRFAARSFLPALGSTYLYTGVLDLMHTLAYEGMGVLPGGGTDLAAQFWIAARLVESGGLLVAMALIDRKRPRNVPLVGIGVCAVLLLYAILTARFPTCFVPGRGLTPFKIAMEYVVCSLLLAAGLLLWRARSRFSSVVASTLLVAIGLTVASELCFTLYEGPFSFFNSMGHLLKAVSFYLIYRAVFEMGLRSPHQLLFRELELQRAALQAANHELDHYARTVSHDLKSPLAAIANGNAAIGLWLKGQPATEALSTLHRANSAVGRAVQTALTLIDDLLLLARAGQTPVDVQSVDVASVLASIRAELEDQIRQLGMRLDLSENLGVVVASPAHIYQLFSNLVRNAMIHGKRQGGRIQVVYLGRNQAGAHEYRVRDDGPGIAPDVSDKLFDAFVRGSSGGTGIGLAIVSRILGVYGGSILTCNDAGACFDFTLHDRNTGAEPERSAPAAEKRPGVSQEQAPSSQP